MPRSFHFIWDGRSRCCKGAEMWMVVKSIRRKKKSIFFAFRFFFCFQGKTQETCPFYGRPERRRLNCKGRPGTDENWTQKKGWKKGFHIISSLLLTHRAQLWAAFLLLLQSGKGKLTPNFTPPQLATFRTKKKGESIFPPKLSRVFYV